MSISPTNLKCPTCEGQNLDATSAPSGNWLSCPSCAGIFIQQGLLASLCKDREECLKILEETKFLLLPTERVCPQCSQKLFDGCARSRGIIFTICQTCHSLWTTLAALTQLDESIEAKLQPPLDDPWGNLPATTSPVLVAPPNDNGLGKIFRQVARTFDRIADKFVHGDGTGHNLPTAKPLPSAPQPFTLPWEPQVMAKPTLREPPIVLKPVSAPAPTPPVTPAPVTPPPNVTPTVVSPPVVPDKLQPKPEPKPEWKPVIAPEIIEEMFIAPSPKQQYVPPVAAPPVPVPPIPASLPTPVRQPAPKPEPMPSQVAPPLPAAAPAPWPVPLEKKEIKAISYVAKSPSFWDSLKAAWSTRSKPSKPTFEPPKVEPPRIEAPKTEPKPEPQKIEVKKPQVKKPEVKKPEFKLPEAKPPKPVVVEVTPVAEIPKPAELPKPIEPKPAPVKKIVTPKVKGPKEPFDARSFWLPWGMSALFVFLSSLREYGFEGEPAVLWGIMGWSMGMYWRSVRMYSFRKFEEKTVLALLETELKGWRGIPVLVKGTVALANMETPKGPVVFVQEEQRIDLNRLTTWDILPRIFGLDNPRQLIQGEVTLTGWYRKGAVPFIEVHEVRSGKTFRKSIVKAMRFSLPIVLFVFALIINLSLE